MKMFFFDLETTGLPTLKSYPQIIEFCGVIYDTKTKDIYKLKNGESAIKTCKYKPIDKDGKQLKLSKFITTLTGIDDNQLKNKPHFSEEWHIWFKIMSQCEKLVAHNASFDIDVFLNNIPITDPNYHKKMCKEMLDKTICTADLNKHFYGEYFSLNRWYKETFNSKVPNHHQAYDDVKAMIDCYSHSKFSKILAK